MAGMESSEIQKTQAKAPISEQHQVPGRLLRGAVQRLDHAGRIDLPRFQDGAH
jgi:hypothetical protein